MQPSKELLRVIHWVTALGMIFIGIAGGIYLTFVARSHQRNVENDQALHNEVKRLQREVNFWKTHIEFLHTKQCDTGPVQDAASTSQSPK